MENNSGFWKWIGAAVVVVVLGLGLGFYISGSPGEDSAIPKANDTAPAEVASTSAVGATSAPARPMGEFTAKGAPEIQIDEQSPSPKKRQPLVQPFSQTPSPASTSDSASATSAAAPAPAAPAPASQSPDANPPAPSPTIAAPPAPARNDAPDTPGTPDAAQSPAPASQATAAQSSGPDSGPLYHVLVGTTFANEKNARIFAADLRHRGFMAMTWTVSGDSGPVYKVQVGAYHSRLAAEQTASQLQQSGYPAYIATDR